MLTSGPGWAVFAIQVLCFLVIRTPRQRPEDVVDWGSFVRCQVAKLMKVNALVLGNIDDRQHVKIFCDKCEHVNVNFLFRI